jgi:glycosyltransferase involved in cell wall biosynthesis
MFTTPDETTAAAADVLGQDKMASIKRVSVRGKFLFHGKSKLWVKGITYGTFSPDENGCQFPSEDVVGQYFSANADTGFNTVRVYTVPPRWLLDLAQQHGLLVLVGLPWEQHVCFLDDRKIADRILDSCRSAVLQLKGHPSLLAYAIGNEIPGPIVRWHGKVAIERFLKRLYRVVKTCDPKTLITYVNYPTTEYLELPFIDFVSFNVYLEDETNKRSYLKRQHNLVDDRPLLLAEVGLDSLRNGELKQAEVLDWQIRCCFEEGCCGICVFAWTDEWYRGGHEITDWQFGLTTIDRKPKSSLAAVESALAAMPFESDAKWPTFCVVVCSFNGEPTIRDTLEGLTRLNYSDYEVIIIDDGSTDSTARIAAEYPFKLISTENRGLSAARNLGWQTATAEIIAYIDDDAYPDPDWLRFLAIAYRDSNLKAVGGPNLAPDGDGWKADCIACSPGGPVHVLLSDTLAEHIPGCNMSFLRSTLDAVGGFDVRFRTAGDDVDICWRVQQEVGDIGFSAAAMVWHHRRNSLKTYWRQQCGYGHAEALLERKWPQKYNSVGHLDWGGKIYGSGISFPLPLRRQRLYQGVWGSAAFQSIYQPVPGLLQSLPLMPEWYLLVIVAAGLAALGFSWSPLAWFSVAAAGMTVVTLSQSVYSAYRSTRFRGIDFASLKFWTVVLLHLMQPLARLKGRLVNGLHPWRRHRLTIPRWPFSKRISLWREQGEDPVTTLEKIQQSLADEGWFARRGGDFDDWDFEVQPSHMVRVRSRMAVEEHGGGRQLLRFELKPRVAAVPAIAILSFGALSLAAAMAHAPVAATGLASAALLGLFASAGGSAHGIGVLRKVIKRLGIAP